MRPRIQNPNSYSGDFDCMIGRDFGESERETETVTVTNKAG